METYNQNSTVTSSLGFKSYYVVWKRIDNARSTGNNNEFKSYYVVWKLYGQPAADVNTATV